MNKRYSRLMTLLLSFVLTLTMSGSALFVYADDGETDPGADDVNYVAEVIKADQEDGDKYTDIGSAYTAIENIRKSGDSTPLTLKLLDDINVDNNYLEVKVPITLDLNGHTITGEASDGTVKSDTEGFVITDSSSDESGKIENRYKPFSDTLFTRAVSVSYTASMTLEHGTLYSYYGYGITLGTLKDTDGNIIHGAKVYINGGTVHGKRASIHASTGTTVDISGGRFSDDLRDVDKYTCLDGHKLYKDAVDEYYHLAQPATVSFDKGTDEGAEISGSMEPVEVGAGLRYELPECSFVNDKHFFGGWIVDGKNYGAGKTVVIDGNTVITANWSHEHKWDEGPGASAASADKAITSMKNDNDPAGSKFAPLKLKSTKQGKTNIKLNWTKASGATSYVVYGNACGAKNKFKKLATVKTNTYNVKKISKKLKKGTYHKFIVVALDKNNNVVSISKVIHAATTGGKVGNHKSVTVTKKVANKAKKLKKSKSLKLKAKAVAKSKKLKVKKHVAVRYESTNTKIATVSKKGVVKAKSKGTCYINAYAQNGVAKKIKVTVK